MKKFDVIIADPPYSFGDRLHMSPVHRGAADNYKVMSIDDICNLPVKNLISPTGSILALWVPSSMLQDGLNIMKFWGFQQKQTYVWTKTKKKPLQNLASILMPRSPLTILNINSYVKQVVNLVKDANINAVLAFGMGRLFRQTHEICLIGISDTKVYKKIVNKSQRSVCIAPNLGHSIKPNNLHESFNTMFSKDSKKIEIFARRHYQGYTCIGNEVCNGEDIKESLAKLL
jgi:N6-adenosine-specific RNA methylase IME4